MSRVWVTVYFKDGSTLQGAYDDAFINGDINHGESLVLTRDNFHDVFYPKSRWFSYTVMYL